MIASIEQPYTDEQRFSDRDAAVREVLTTTAGLVGLSHRGEQDIRMALKRHVDMVLDLADSATAARSEYEAFDNQLDRHVRTHPGCAADTKCGRFRVLQIRRQKCWDVWAAAYRDLIRGRR